MNARSADRRGLARDRDYRDLTGDVVLEQRFVSGIPEQILVRAIRGGASERLLNGGSGRGDMSRWRDETVMPEALAHYLRDELGAPPRDMGPEGAIRRNLRLSDERAATLYLQFVPPSDACR